MHWYFLPLGTARLPGQQKQTHLVALSFAEAVLDLIWMEDELKMEQESQQLVGTV